MSAQITHWQTLVERIAIRDRAHECVIRDRAKWANVLNAHSDNSLPDMLAFARIVRMMRERRITR